jgi:hypothetical protein
LDFTTFETKNEKRISEKQPTTAAYFDFFKLSLVMLNNFSVPE